MKFEDICNWIKSQDKTIKNVCLENISNVAIEEKITEKGVYKIVLQFDAKNILFNPKRIPKKPSDCKFRLMLLVIEQDWEKIHAEQLQAKKQNDL